MLHLLKLGRSCVTKLQHFQKAKHNIQERQFPQFLSLSASTSQFVSTNCSLAWVEARVGNANHNGVPTVRSLEGDSFLALWGDFSNCWIHGLSQVERHN